MEKATSRQTWAIFCATGYDVRACNLSKEKASELIGLQKAGQDIGEFIQSLPGAVLKGKAKQPAHDWQAVYNEAHAAGLAAGQAFNPAPMIVQQHQNQLDDKSPVEKQYFVSDGVCGFAWVVVSPGTHSFARWASKNLGAKKDYYGGITVKWVGEFGQSMEKKIAYAQAFTGVLRGHGIPANTRDRMD